MKNHLKGVGEELPKAPVNQGSSGFSVSPGSQEEWSDYLMKEVINQSNLELQSKSELERIQHSYIETRIFLMRQKLGKNQASFGDEYEKELPRLEALLKEMRNGEYENVVNYMRENRNNRERVDEKTTNDSQNSPSGSSSFRGLRYDKNTTQNSPSYSKTNLGISKIVAILKSQSLKPPYYDSNASLYYPHFAYSPESTHRSIIYNPEGSFSKGSSTWRGLSFDNNTTLNTRYSAKAPLDISEIEAKSEWHRRSYYEPTARGYIPSHYRLSLSQSQLSTNDNSWPLSSSQSQLSPNDNSWPRGQVKVRAEFFNSLSKTPYLSPAISSSQNSSSASSDLYDLGIYQLTSPKFQPPTQRSIEFQLSPTRLPTNSGYMQGSIKRRYTDELLSLSPWNPRTDTVMDGLRADYFERSSVIPYSNFRNDASSYFSYTNQANINSNEEPYRRNVDKNNQYRNGLSSSPSSSPPSSLSPSPSPSSANAHNINNLRNYFQAKFN